MNSSVGNFNELAFERNYEKLLSTAKWSKDVLIYLYIFAIIEIQALMAMTKTGEGED